MKNGNHREEAWRRVWEEMDMERQEGLGRPLWLAYVVPGWAFSPEDLANLRANPPEIGGLVDDIESMAANICRAAFGNPNPPLDQISPEPVAHVLEQLGYERIARNHLMRNLRVRATFPGEWGLLVNNLIVPAQSATDPSKRATNMTTFATLLTRLFPTALSSRDEVGDRGRGDGAEDRGREFAQEYFRLATRWFQSDLPHLSEIGATLVYSSFRAFLAGSFRVIIDEFVKYSTWQGLPTDLKEKMLDFSVAEETHRGRGDETNLKIVFSLRRFNGHTVRDKVRSCRREISRRLDEIRAQAEEEVPDSVFVEQEDVPHVAESSAAAARRAPRSQQAVPRRPKPSQQSRQRQPQPSVVQVASPRQTRLDSPVEPPITPAPLPRQQVAAVVVGQPPAPVLTDFLGLIIKQSVFAARSWDVLLEGYAVHNENLAAADQRSILVVADIPYFVTNQYWDTVDFALNGSLPIPVALLNKSADEKIATFLRKHLNVLKKIGKGRNVMTFTCCSYAQAVTLMRFLETQQSLGWGDLNVTAFTMGTMRRVGMCE